MLLSKSSDLKKSQMHFNVTFFKIQMQVICVEFLFLLHSYMYQNDVSQMKSRVIQIHIDII